MLHWIWLLLAIVALIGEQDYRYCFTYDHYIDKTFNSTYDKAYLEGRFCDDNKYGYLCKFKDMCGRVSRISTRPPKPPQPPYGAYILGGENLRLAEFPSFAQLVSIMTRTDTYRIVQYCSGSIISDYHIVTARHCVHGDTGQAVSTEVYVGTNRVVVAGEKGGLKVKTVCTHPEHLDIAILTLANKLTFDDYIQPACWKFDEEPMYKANDWCWQVGAGKSSVFNVPLIRKMRVRIDTDKSVYRPGYLTLVNDHNATVCRGDSGGPLLCLKKDWRRWTVVGVASSGTCKKNFPWYYDTPVDQKLARTTMGSCGVDGLE